MFITKKPHTLFPYQSNVSSTAAVELIILIYLNFKITWFSFSYIRRRTRHWIFVCSYFVLSNMALVLRKIYDGYNYVFYEIKGENKTFNEWLMSMMIFRWKVCKFLPHWKPSNTLCNDSHKLRANDQMGTKIHGRQKTVWSEKCYDDLQSHSSHPQYLRRNRCKFCWRAISTFDIFLPYFNTNEFK